MSAWSRRGGYLGVLFNLVFKILFSSWREARPAWSLFASLQEEDKIFKKNLKKGLSGDDGEAVCKSFLLSFFLKILSSSRRKPGLPGHDGEDVCKSFFHIFLKILSSSWREAMSAWSQQGDRKEEGS